VLCVSHYIYLIVTSQAHSLAILTTDADAGLRLTLTVDYPPAGYVSRDYVVPAYTAHTTYDATRIDVSRYLTTPYVERGRACPNVLLRKGLRRLVEVTQ